MFGDLVELADDDDGVDLISIWIGTGLGSFMIMDEDVLFCFLEG